MPAGEALTGIWFLVFSAGFAVFVGNSRTFFGKILVPGFATQGTIRFHGR